MKNIGLPKRSVHLVKPQAETHVETAEIQAAMLPYDIHDDALRHASQTVVGRGRSQWPMTAAFRDGLILERAGMAEVEEYFADLDDVANLVSMGLTATAAVCLVTL